MTDVMHTLLALEERLLQPAIRATPAAVASLLAEDFREFGSSGRVYTKAEIVSELAAQAPRDITLSNFAGQLFSPDAALVTYRSRSGSGEALRSSLWVWRDERWQMLFHQGTMLPSAQPNDAVC